MNKKEYICINMVVWECKAESVNAIPSQGNIYLRFTQAVLQRHR